MSDPDSFDLEDFIQALTSMRKTLDEANVPKEGRFIQVQYETIEGLFGKEFADNLWREFE